MGANITDPFLLASYPVPIRQGRPSSSKQPPGSASHVLVDSRHASSSERADNFVSLAVQGDGIHVLDLSTLHPAVSHTLGPNTTFSCPPTSRTSRKSGTKICTTYAAVASSPDVLEEDRERTVWWWEESLSGGVMSADAQKKRKSRTLPHRVTHIYAPEDLPDHLIITGLGGRLTVTDPELNQISSSSSQEVDTVLLRHFVFPRQACTFLPAETFPSNGVISISALRRNTDVLLSVSLVDTEGKIHSFGDCTVAADDTDIVDVSFSTSGCLSVLTRSGKWTAYRVSVSPSSTLSTLPLSPPVYLFSLSFLSSVSHASAHTSEISLLALTSSHVLLACITLANPEITLLLWDVQYGVILAEQQFACPLNLYRGKGRGVRMDLVASGSAAEPSQALLVLHPADAKSQESLFPRATSVLVVPLSVPRTSTIANALGRAAASQAYLRPEADSPQRVKGTQLTLELGGLEPEQGRTLKALLEVQEKGRTAEVEKRWAAYVEAGGPEGKPRLGHLFVKQLLDVLFLVPSPGRDVATTNATEAYARGVLTYLLERRAVSDAMIEGGLLPALMVRNDWSNAVLALSTVIDLPESDIISLLAKVVAHHRQSNTNPDAMQVDSPSPSFSTPPTLPAFLALCVTSPASPGPLRVALRKHLPDAEDVACLLEVLDEWVGKWGEEELRLVPDRVKKDTHGMYVPIFEDERKPDMPPLDKILLFTQAVLDSSFVALLAHPPAHALLRTLLARLEPELALIAELQSLKGPLSAFASAQSRSAFLHGPGRAKGESQDWRQRKKAQTEQREMNIGMYQMEELVI